MNCFMIDLKLFFWNTTIMNKLLYQILELERLLHNEER